MSLNNDEMTVSEFEQISAVPEVVAPDVIEVVADDPMTAGLREMLPVLQRLSKLRDVTPGLCYIFATNKEDFQKISRSMGRFEKTVSDDYFNCTRRFSGGFGIQLTIARSSVCTRKQVGTKHVPELTIPAHDEPIFEWDCTPSILSPVSQEAAPAAEPAPLADYIA